MTTKKSIPGYAANEDVIAVLADKQQLIDELIRNRTGKEGDMPQPATKKAAQHPANTLHVLGTSTVAGTTQPAERLDAGEMAYHRTVLAQAEAAQAIFNSWAAHLNAKYGLTPADRLDNATGVITRAAKAE